MPNAWHEPYNKALDYLSRREYGSLELQKKLIKFGYETNLVDSAIENLQKNGLQDDQRFVESYMRSRSRRGFGPNKIQQELYQKGIEEHLIDEVSRVLQETGELNWQQIIEGQYQKKYRNAQANNYNEWARRARFLQGRGFTFEQINSVIGSTYSNQ